MSERPYTVLFLCTGNSARSILGEAILNREGKGRFEAYSAGSYPKGTVNPNTLRLLESLNYDISEFRSKSWDEFAGSEAPQFDFVFTVCDAAAGEACPVWPGRPMTAHWGIPDPASVEGNYGEVSSKFKDAYRLLQRRIAEFTSLPIDRLDRMSLNAKLREIGSGAGATDKARQQV